jgi:hypothetical protein
LGLWWLWWWNVRRLLIFLRHPDRFPRDLLVAELWGSLRGLGRYPQARPVRRPEWRIPARLRGLQDDDVAPP